MERLADVLPLLQIIEIRSLLHDFSVSSISHWLTVLGDPQNATKPPEATTIRHPSTLAHITPINSKMERMMFFARSSLPAIKFNGMTVSLLIAPAEYLNLSGSENVKTE